jgi:hypothetical protein
MTSYFKIGIGTILAVSSLAAEPYTYSGVIVNARCMQAAEIVSRNAHAYTPPSVVNAFAGAQHKPLHTDRLRKTILRHCAVNAGVTEFALLDGGGNFFLLDETGNLQVIAQPIPVARDTGVIIRGNVDRATLNVQSLSKRAP